MKKGFVYPGVRGEPIDVEPGIYQAADVPFETYLSWNAISNSSLGAAVREISPLVISMCHYKHQEPKEETQAMRFGKWAHAAKFEFLKAIEDYDIKPDFTKYKVADDGSLIEDPCKNSDGKTVSKVPKNTDDYRNRVAKYEALPDKVGKIFIEAEEAENLSGLLYALDRHKLASHYFRNEGAATDREVSIVWIDKPTGLKCKARIDCVQHSDRMTIDLKTVAELGAFEKAIANWCYHRQGAWYADGFKALTGETYTAAIVAGEKRKHAGVIAAPLSFSAMAAGRSQYRLILDKIAACIESKVWPAQDSPEEFELPAWAMPNLMEELTPA